MQGHGRIIAHDFCVAHREANSGLSTLNRTKSILSIYHQQRQLQKQRGMCLNGTYPFCQQPLSGNCHSICFSKPVLWTATPRGAFFTVKQEGARLFIKISKRGLQSCPLCGNIRPSIRYSPMNRPEWKDRTGRELWRIPFSWVPKVQGARAPNLSGKRTEQTSFSLDQTSPELPFSGSSIFYARREIVC